MDTYYFTEMPYTAFPESEVDKYPAMRLTFPNSYFDPNTAHDLFKRYLDEYQYAEDVGFDGLMINELLPSLVAEDREAGESLHGENGGPAAGGGNSGLEAAGAEADGARFHRYTESIFSWRKVFTTIDLVLKKLERSRV